MTANGQPLHSCYFTVYQHGQGGREGCAKVADTAGLTRQNRPTRPNRPPGRRTLPSPRRAAKPLPSSIPGPSLAESLFDAGGNTRGDRHTYFIPNNDWRMAPNSPPRRAPTYFPCPHDPSERPQALVANSHRRYPHPVRQSTPNAHLVSLNWPKRNPPRSALSLANGRRKGR